jgi:hypothetical protein
MARISISGLAVAAVLGAVLLSGCGGSDSNGSTAAAGNGTVSVPRTAPGGEAEREAPKGASPLLREIYRQFPRPQASPAIKGSKAAVKAGIVACKGKSPLQAKEAFYAEALENGNLQAGSPQAKMIAKLPSFEGRADSAFTAGQLAADTYQATLPEATAQFGYQGCIYSLAQRLKQELAAAK